MNLSPRTLVALLAASVAGLLAGMLTLKLFGEQTPFG
jgi:hypothetical protein